MTSIMKKEERRKRRTVKRDQLGFEIELGGPIHCALTTIKDHLSHSSASYASRWALAYAAKNMTVKDGVALDVMPSGNVIIQQIEDTHRPEVREHLEKLRTLIAALDGETTTTNRRVIECAVLYTAERLARHE